MKHLLITGKSGYIAQNFAQFLRQFSEEYTVDLLSLRDGAWKDVDCSRYDAVVHTVGIAHVREKADNALLYDSVNRDLTLEVAKWAKEGGIRQFVFLSSMSVYGMDEGTITKETAPKPISHYGKSKFQAEEGLRLLASEDFVVSILRPPMVYGVGCKGNYQTLVKIARKAPIFPDYRNQRSMVSIETLCLFMKEIIDRREGGIFVPQEKNYVCTSQMVRELAEKSGKRIRLVRWLNPAVFLAKRFTRTGKKAFGNLIYKEPPLK